jgi:hypothetical protein
VEEAGGEVVEEAARAAGVVAQVFLVRRGAVFGEEGQDGDDNNDNNDPASTILEECRLSSPLLETSRSPWRQF